MEDLVVNDLDVFIEHDINFWRDYEEKLIPHESHLNFHIPIVIVIQVYVEVPNY